MNNDLCKLKEEKKTNKHGVDMNGCDGKSGGTKKKRIIDFSTCACERDQRLLFHLEPILFIDFFFYC